MRTIYEKNNKRILNKTDLNEWIREEKRLYIGDNFFLQIKKKLLYDHDYAIWKFVRSLRICEYHYNTNHRIRYILWQNRKNHLGEKLGITAWHNTIGKGVRFWHYGSVIVNGHSVIGRNCQLHGNNCIGNNGMNDEKAPCIGNNVELGVGASIIGDIYIADNIKIGANAVVVKSCFTKGATLVGVPAHESIK